MWPEREPAFEAPCSQRGVGVAWAEIGALRFTASGEGALWKRQQEEAK